MDAAKTKWIKHVAANSHNRKKEKGEVDGIDGSLEIKSIFRLQRKLVSESAIIPRIISILPG